MNIQNESRILMLRNICIILGLIFGLFICFMLLQYFIFNKHEVYVVHSMGSYREDVVLSDSLNIDHVDRKVYEMLRSR